MNNKFEPKLGFQFPFDEAAAYDAEARGYLAHVYVEFQDGSRCPVVFYDAVRLQQDLEEEAKAGRAFIAEPGLIVLPEVTLGRMQDAIAYLHKQGYFESFRRDGDFARASIPALEESELLRV